VFGSSPTGWNVGAVAMRVGIMANKLAEVESFMVVFC
jgi:hypothetical protein